MRLPNAARAVVEIGKLRDYSLNPQHEVGKHKARVFRSALGLTPDDAVWLREFILNAVRDEEVVSGPTPSPFGEKYVVDISAARAGRTAVVRTTWIVEHGMDFPRLTSCYVR
jgi:uncharacterized protein DUF6883